MMKNTKKDTFFDLLCQNDPIKLKEFLLMNGKGPKPRCPITFIGQDRIDEISQYYIGAR